MKNENFNKLHQLYTELIEIICNSKESTSNDIKTKFLLDLFYRVKECLDFSPYTHFYTQILIDIIVKTYNSNTFRTDILFKNQIEYKMENPKYFCNEEYENLAENPYTTNLLLYEWMQNIDNFSNKKHDEYIEYFEIIKNLLLENLKQKRLDLIDRLELISKLSNNSNVKNLTINEKLYLYETKNIFDLHYFNTNPAHSIFLDTNFKTKYICNEKLSEEEKNLDVEKLIEIIKERHLEVENVYELKNAEEQIKFELFQIIQNNFTINKCENCGRLFIPTTTSKNPNQKGRNDQKYCNYLYLDTDKTCRKIGALNKRKEKVQKSLILTEFQREYKRMYGLHYNHQKEFNEKQFKEWSKKAHQLKNNFSDEQIEEFKVELKNLSKKFWMI